MLVILVKMYQNMYFIMCTNVLLLYDKQNVVSELTNHNLPFPLPLIFPIRIEKSITLCQLWHVKKCKLSLIAENAVCCLDDVLNALPL